MLQIQTRATSKLWIGIDFHKKTWRVHFRSEFSGNPFSMEPNPELLRKKVLKEFPNYKVEIVYECGCFGYWAHRKFESYAWKSYVVNPADLPRISKQRFQKSDTIDARNLSKLLSLGLLRCVSIPDIKREQFRGLFRRRNHLVRMKNLLIYYGIKIPDQWDNANWTHDFRDWIKNLQWDHPTAKYMMDSNLRQEISLHYEINEVGNELRKYCRNHYRKSYDLLQSIPGVGPLTAICFIAEVGNVSRF